MVIETGPRYTPMQVTPDLIARLKLMTIACAKCLRRIVLLNRSVASSANCYYRSSEDSTTTTTKMLSLSSSGLSEGGEKRRFWRWPGALEDDRCRE